MSAQTPTTSRLFTLVRRHRNTLAGLLILLVFAVLALDYFHGALFGPHLLGLRLIYAALALLISGYVYIVSTMP